MSIEALDDFGTHLLIRTDHVPVLFGVELGGECGGIDQVAEHHRELAAFRVGSEARSIDGDVSWTKAVPVAEALG